VQANNLVFLEKERDKATSEVDAGCDSGVKLQKFLSASFVITARPLCGRHDLFHLLV
jgi:hypothetical protein